MSTIALGFLSGFFGFGIPISIIILIVAYILERNDIISIDEIIPVLIIVITSIFLVVCLIGFPISTYHLLELKSNM